MYKSYKLYREPTEDDDSKYPILIASDSDCDKLLDVIDAHLELNDELDESMFYITGVE